MEEDNDGDRTMAWRDTGDGNNGDPFVSATGTRMQGCTNRTQTSEEKEAGKGMTRSCGGRDDRCGWGHRVGVCAYNQNYATTTLSKLEFLLLLLFLFLFLLLAS